MQIRSVLFVLANLAVHSALAGDLRPGDYLEDDFIKALQATQSPYHALQEPGLGPQSIMVVQGEKGLRFIANYNWHEGEIFAPIRHGSVRRGEDGRNYPMPQIQSDRSFRFANDVQGQSWHTYSWVGDADAAVARMTLVGRYVDPSGHIVQFGADGMLRGFGPDVPFWLENDHLETHFDFFDFGKSHDAASTLAFEHRGQMLILYPLLPAAPASPGIGDPDYKHPRLVLKRLTSPVGPL